MIDHIPRTPSSSFPSGRAGVLCSKLVFGLHRALYAPVPVSLTCGTSVPAASATVVTTTGTMATTVMTSTGAVAAAVACASVVTTAIVAGAMAAAVVTAAVVTATSEGGKT